MRQDWAGSKIAKGIKAYHLYYYFVRTVVTEWVTTDDLVHRPPSPMQDETTKRLHTRSARLCCIIIRDFLTDLVQLTAGIA